MATSLSYAYTGNRRNAYSYDLNGNVTSDATNSLQSSYNLINLPAQIKSGSTVKANYSYLSDGTKTKALNASSVGYDYAGTFTYSHASNGSKTLESVAFGGGRIRKSGSTYAVDYHITDHLGSVRAIVNASGSVVEQNDYYPFGNRHPNGLTTLAANRWRFSGKEEQDSAFGIAYSDFGARFYDRSAAWTAIDPFAEKYYSVSQYVYCKNNPVNRVDPNGMTDWKKVLQGVYAVAGGVASTIGGAVMAGGTGGTMAAFSAFLISDGIVSIGTGMTLMTVGFIDDAQLTEKAQDIPMSIPEMGGVAYDALSGESDHIGKKMGSIIDYGIGVFAIGVWGPRPIVPTAIGFSAQTKSLYDSFMEEKRNGVEANDVYILDAQNNKSPYLWNPDPELKFLYPEE